jgi:ABC-type transport system substrate-binding protein
MAFPSVLTLAGCGDSRLPPPHRFGAGRAAPRRGGTLRFSSALEILTLDPAFNSFSLDDYAVDLFADTVVDYAPSTAPHPTELVPQLAKRWSCSADSTVYTFHLREDAKFSNGEPVLAEDFVFSLDRMLDPGSRCPVAGLGAANHFRP